MSAVAVLAQLAAVKAEAEAVRGEGPRIAARREAAAREMEEAVRQRVALEAEEKEQLEALLRARRECQVPQSPALTAGAAVSLSLFLSLSVCVCVCLCAPARAHPCAGGRAGALARACGWVALTAGCLGCGCRPVLAV